MVGLRLGQGLGYLGGAFGLFSTGQALYSAGQLESLAAEAEKLGQPELASKFRELKSKEYLAGAEGVALGVVIPLAAKYLPKLSAARERQQRAQTEINGPYMSQKDLLKEYDKLNIKANTVRGQKNNGFKAEADQTLAMANYHGKKYKVREVNGPLKKFPNGKEGQTDAELTIFLSANKGVDVIVESKGKGLDIAQIQKYQSTGTKSIFVVRDEKALNNKSVLTKIQKAFEGDIAKARGQVFVMSREQYLNFLKSGEIPPSFKSFLSSATDQDIPLTMLLPALEEKLFVTLGHIPKPQTQ